MTTRKEIDVILCTSCSGKGEIEKSELMCYHKGEYQYWTEACKRCEGSGRLLMTTETTTTIVPYKKSL